ncbi:cell division protein FtsQ/DivIB [Colwellia sp. MSW7]|uniref:Cell division protein FtsQ n=1 Tax=Colwellia maritima TaxID=2912588 RepID=A0ABS9X610_9GAMM|nr:cell division protein FtsQ/DivIB [Colwellia maritima]MCI2285659.1 cell division protein FtsQ/DivIB [Colwellia maritima]
MSNKQLSTENQRALSFGLGLAFFVCVLISLVSLGWWLTQIFIEQEHSPVNSIVITGEMPYTQREEVIAALSDVDLGNFFQVNVNDIQAQVSALPWVYSVAVRKQWPNEVKIYVVDQTPIALWNGDFILNQFGNAFQAQRTALKQALPEFFGPEGSELLALENFHNLNDLLEYRNLRIDELILSERFSWQLTLNNGIRLNLGREERVKRVQRFMDVYPLIKTYLAEQENAKNNEKKQIKQAVDYIDLRYDTGLAVGRKDVTKLSSNKPVKQQKSHRTDIFPSNELQTKELILNV